MEEEPPASGYPSMHPLTTAIAVADNGLREELRAAITRHPVRIVLEQPAIESLQLRRLNLDLIFIDATPAGESLEALVQRIRMLAPQCLITVVSRNSDPHLILSAMHAGSQEFVYAPFEEQLQPAMQRLTALISQREIAARPPGKTIGFVSAKGGCGATTVACHAAACLQRVTDNELLLADFDFEAGLIGFLMKPPTTYTVADAVQNVHRLDASLWKGYVGTVMPRLDVIPSSVTTSFGEHFRPENLRQVLRLVRSLYGWVLADLGRGLNPFTMELIEDFDELCVVAKPTVTAVYQAKQIVQRLADHGVNRAKVHIVLNQVGEGSALDRREIESVLRGEVFATIPIESSLELAYAEGKLMALNTALGSAFAAVAAKLAGVPLLPSEPSRGWGVLFGRRRAVTAG